MGALTHDLPKPMLPLGGRPMIDRAIDLLREAGVHQIVANVHYLADRIAPHLESRGVHVVHEKDVILDTGGGLKAALPLLGNGPVITFNPDALWIGSNPVETLMRAWREDMRALLLLVDRSCVTGGFEKGDFSLEHGEIRRNGRYLYGGAQIISPELMDMIQDRVFSLNQYWDLLAEHRRLDGLLYDGRWCDLGTAEGLLQAEAELRDV